MVPTFHAYEPSCRLLDSLLLDAQQLFQFGTLVPKLQEHVFPVLLFFGLFKHLTDNYMRVFSPTLWAPGIKLRS